jgi:hypothetical protein
MITIPEGFITLIFTPELGHIILNGVNPNGQPFRVRPRQVNFNESANETGLPL